MRSKIITSGQFKKYGIKREYRASVPLTASVKSASVKVVKGKRYLTGYAGTTGRDRARDNITLSAWKEAKDHLLQAGAKTVFYNHNTDIAIGKVVKTAVDNVGLLVKVMISKAKDVDNYWIKIKEGVLNALSIRLHPKKIEIVEDENTGKILEYKILAMELFEVSVVGIPMQTQATINSVVGKSFDRAIVRYNKHRSSTMLKKRKKSVKPAAVPSIEEQISSSAAVKALAETQKQIAKALGGLGAQLAELNERTMSKEEKVHAAERQAKRQAKALKAASKDNAAIGMLATMVMDLQKRFGGDGTRKGGTTDDGAGQPDGTIKKTLKSAEDVDTVKYVLWLMEEDKNGNIVHADGKAAFKALTEEEKALAKQIYGQLLISALERE